MKTPSVHRSAPGFTLIEMLVVIAIIAILAGILLPVLAAAKEKARVAQAKTEVRNIAAAIVAYQGAYSVYPASKNDAEQAGAAVIQDITYTNNAATVVILLDLDTAPNEGHRRNPQKHVYLNAKMVNSATLPGISTIDNNFRDPWGRPYIITLDLNYDNKCDDTLLGTSFPAPVAVWSLGRDGKSDATLPPGAKKDDVTSW